MAGVVLNVTQGFGLGLLLLHQQAKHVFFALVALLCLHRAKSLFLTGCHDGDALWDGPRYAEM